MFSWEVEGLRRNISTLQHYIYLSRWLWKALQNWRMKTNNNSMKFLCLLVLSAAITAATEIAKADAAGECGKVPPDRMALRLSPCIAATQDPQAQVSDSCCSQIQQLGQNPSCLCAVMLSNTAKFVGVKPDVAVTIPKRCNLVDRPIGYKCGGA